MFSFSQLALVLFLEGCAEAIRLHSVGTHPFYPHIIILAFTLVPTWIRWRAWCTRAEKKRSDLVRDLPGPDDSSKHSRKTIVGFFHPYCNAGGGGEVVLWTAVSYVQRTEPDVVCAVYTGDTDATKEQIISKVKTRFDIELSPLSLSFVWLKSREQVDAKTWPRFTLLGQSFGSVLLAVEALDHLVPDIFIDTMGYAFTFPLVSILGRFLYRIPIGAYVHYPTISTDMLERVRNRKTGYANKDDVTSSWLKSTAKLIYYRIFAFLYSTSLLQADTIVVNSSWTKSHIDSLINSARKRLGKTAPGKTSGVEIVYPPCHMDKLREFPLQGRERVILSVAQFRPEKEHEVQIRAFHSLLTQHPNLRNGSDAVRLVLLGGCRTEEDEKRVEILKRLTEELGLEANVEFVTNAPYSTLLNWLARSSVGISTMVDEHFGINIVEYMASGLIPLVHDSGGPKLDIVLPYHSQSAGLTLPTGYHATSSESYATALANIFVETNASDIMDMRERARTRAVERFGRDEFERGWVAFWDSLRAQGTALGGRTEDSLKDQ